jgi:Tfp pilus assembly PilM family ATPase
VRAVRTGRAQTLPLGIDLGAQRIRVALVQRDEAGRVELLAVATRERGDHPAAALADAVAEIRTSERRCVFGLGEPQAVVRHVRFPPMKRAEHERAARFEAAQLVDYPMSDALVRVVALGTGGDAVIGVVRKELVHALVALAHSAKLRLSAIDDHAFAFRRALPDTDAVLDIGAAESRLHVFAGPIPASRHFPIGGTTFTHAVAQALGSDPLTAAGRKHRYGIAGCGEAVCEALVADVAQALVECRAAGLGDVRAVSLAGNGSRLAELPATIERATAVRVRPATLDSSISRGLPPDVLRAAAPDWCLAYGLALWAAT